MSIRFRWVETGSQLKLGLRPHPKGGSRLSTEIISLKSQGVDVLVSLLQPKEASVLKLDQEGEICQEVGLEFRHFPIRDHDVPHSFSEVQDFATELLSLAQAGKSILFHCCAGIGRSATMAAATLIVAGFDPDDACKRLTAARGFPVPETGAQKKWLHSFTAGLQKKA